MIAAVRSDPTLLVVAIVTVVAVVLATRHGRTWWHRHTGDHHPARTGRLVIAVAAIAGLGVLTAGMALGSGASADPKADDDSGRSEPGGLVFGGPVPARPEPAPATSSAGS